MIKLEDIIKDTKFLEKISSASTDEEIQNILSTKNINISLHQVKEAKKVAEGLKNKNGKVEDATLENIAGGKWYDGVYALSKSAAVLATGVAVLYGVYKVTNNLDQLTSSVSQVTNNLGRLTDSASDTINSVGNLASTVDNQVSNLGDKTSHLIDNSNTLVQTVNNANLSSIPFIGKAFSQKK